MVLGLIGTAGSGKSTAADYLKSKGFKEIILADPLKKILMMLFNLSEEQLNTERKEEQDLRLPIPKQYAPSDSKGSWYLNREDTVYFEPGQKYFKPRNLLQIVGTEWFRSISEDYWVTIALHDIATELSQSPGADIVISDCRFQNEASMVQRLGGSLIRIVRDNNTSNDKHTSETEQSMIQHNYKIVNNGSVNDLYNQLHEIVDTIRKESS